MTKEDANDGKQVFVSNALEDGFSYKMSVHQSMIFATHGKTMEIVILVIKVILYNKEDV